MPDHSTVVKLADTPWPEGGLVRVKHCPVCGSERRKLLHEGLSDNVFFCAPGRWTMYQCTECRSGYLDPRPSEETLGLAYSTYYTHAENDTQVTHRVAPRQFVATFRQRLRNGYENYRFGLNLKPASLLGILVGICWPRMANVIDHKNYYITNRPRRILEVGFGSGHFLSQAKTNGWEPVGVDFDPVVVANARKKGFRVYEGGVEAIPEKEEKFDAAVLSHVIEHVSNPQDVLRSVFAALNPGGMIYLDTPNLASGGHAEFGMHWRGLEPPRHLAIFTWDSLEQLLREVGFENLKRHRRPRLTPMIWKASSRIQMDVQSGCNNTGTTNIPLLRQLAPYFQISAQEFVTLTAKKP